MNYAAHGYTASEVIQAIRHNAMHMEDYIKQLDSILLSTGEKLLTDSGKISHNQAIEKARTEYKKYQVKTITPVEEVYLRTIKELNNKASNKNS